MASWGRWASRLTRSASRRLESARTGVFGERLARQVVPYRGFGSDTEVFVSGRVLANRPARPVTETDAWWRNLAHALHHLESDEVTGADVRIRAFGAERSVLTDDEGYFRTWLRPAQALIPDGAWHDVAVEVTHPVHPDAGRVQAAGRILLPGSNAEYGIISDLDDTVIRTEATRLLRMLKRTLLENARTRLPFPGVTAFYAALRDGAAGDAGNPVFYVSSSPWNLYGLLTDFLDHQSIPDGPLMLRDWGINAASGLPTRHGAHKRDAIRMIMRCYPGLPSSSSGTAARRTRKCTATSSTTRAAGSWPSTSGMWDPTRTGPRPSASLRRRSGAPAVNCCSRMTPRPARDMRLAGAGSAGTPSRR
jgi:phosphatidate phosphatase APP1